MTLSINPLISRLRCSLSGREVDSKGFTSPVGLCSCCPAPGRPVEVEYDLERAVREKRIVGMFDRTADTAPQGMLRYAPLLPVHGLAQDYAADVGATPIIRHDALSRDLGVDYFIKCEGGNPSNSFKDRGLVIGVAFGAACGAQRFCLPTQGNAGVAAALFCSRLGLPPAIVYMPDGYQQSIYQRACTFFGGDVRFAGENIAAAGAKMREELAAPLASGEYVDLSTFFEPGRLEGKKTMGLEIFDHFGPTTLPDWILYPTGGGTGLVGIWKALAELIELGLLDERQPLPRLVAVQSEACAPVVRSFEKGLEQVEPVESTGTVADGLDVPRAIMGHRMLAALRESGGTAIAVLESHTVAAFEEYGRRGVSAGFESAALLAALRSMRVSGTIAEGARVLLLHTSGPFAGLDRA
ncbi:MAG: pyridoxal-phosphate dependent enzyme [bacterium]|nr:pyridoxal-phosphate dependent enzyme [bacterium]